MRNPFTDPDRPQFDDGLFGAAELGLANRNAGNLLETLGADITPTGLHYLLIHFDVPMIAPDAHVLVLGDGFENPMHLTMDDIAARPAVSRAITLECAGNGRADISPRPYSMPWGQSAVGTSQWTGTPLAPLLAEARPKTTTAEIVFTGADYGFDKGHGHYYARSLTLDEIADRDPLLVYGMNDAPLLPQHGAPLRLIVPGWYGMASVKWLNRIEAIDHAFQGFQQVGTYRLRQADDDPGIPIRDMNVRALMVPPGVPDWTSRARALAPGPVEIVGRAWSGNGRAITDVEFAADGVWTPATLAPNDDAHAWTRWHAHWNATPGHHVLQCRARDADGRCQPETPTWNTGGFCNNAIQAVDVFVMDGATHA